MIYFFAEAFGGIARHAELASRKRHQPSHPVAAVDVQRLADGPQSVCGIGVARVFTAVLPAPVVPVARRTFASPGFPDSRNITAVLPAAVETEFAQIVDISPFGMNDLPEKPLLRHIEGRQFEEIVATVFEHHAMAAGLLCRIDQFPALLYGNGSRHLYGHVFALLHGINRHGRMAQPVSADIDQIDVGSFAKPFPVLRAHIFRSFGSRFLPEHGLAACEVLRLQIAKGHDFYAIEVHEPFDGADAAHAQPDEPDPDDRDRIAREGNDVGLSRPAFLRMVTAGRTAAEEDRK